MILENLGIYTIIDFLVFVIGVSGVFTIAVAFILEDLDILSKNHHSFSLMNAYASFALLYYSWYNTVWLFVVLNIMMLFVNFYGIWKVYKK